jgi:hypothetical protein
VTEMQLPNSHFGGFLLQRDCPGERAWFLPIDSRGGEFYGFEPMPNSLKALTISLQASLLARPAIGLATLLSIAPYIPAVNSKVLRRIE